MLADQTVESPENELALNELGVYEFFERIGKTVINPGGLNGRDKLIKTLSPIKKDDHVLEVGSGTGHAACHIAETFDCYVTAIDNNEQMIKRSKETVQQRLLADRVTCEQGNILQLNFPDNSFDAVIIQAVLMFVDKKQALKEIFRVLKPGGQIAALEFCWKKSPDPLLKAETYAICGCDGLSFMTYDEWRKLLESSHFTESKSNPQAFEMLSARGFIQDEGLPNIINMVKKTFANGGAKRMWTIYRHFSRHLPYFEYTILHGIKENKPIQELM
ncbi:MAG: class I SAM-dependent methyltransferase [Thiohalomonadales bacterium]